MFPRRGTDRALSEELAAMAKADQESLNRSLQAPGGEALQEAQKALVARHEARLREIVKAIGWPRAERVGPSGVHASWLVVQHSSAPFIEDEATWTSGGPKWDWAVSPNTGPNWPAPIRRAHGPTEH